MAEPIIRKLAGAYVEVARNEVKITNPSCEDATGHHIPAATASFRGIENVKELQEMLYKVLQKD